MPIRLLLRSFIFVLLIGIAGMCWVMVFLPGPENSHEHIIIEKGTTLETMAKKLEAHNVVLSRYGFIFAAILSQKRRHLIPGEYFFPKGFNAWQVVQKISKGQVITHYITLVEGSTIETICDQLTNNQRLSGSITTRPPEGMCLPQTYDYYYGDDRQKLLDRFQKAMKTTLESIWNSRSSDLILKSPNALLILASIVEKETAIAGEYASVASVYLNRLATGMRLQADPTVAYGLKVAGKTSSPLTLKDLQFDSPYNTYIHTGLPPTPICCPGEAAIHAVAKAPKSQLYYFVANGSGGHLFSKTYQEHLGNVKKWRAINKG